MRILYLANHVNAGGITQYMLILACALRARGHQVYAASSGGDREGRFTECGVECWRMPLATKSEVSPGVALSFWRLHGMLKREKIDIIHANTRVTQVLAYYLSRATGVPYVTTCHGFFRPRWHRRAFGCWGSRVIAISAQVEEHLVRDLRVLPQRVVRIPHGVAVPAVDSSVAAALRESLGLAGARVIGIIARLSDVKGHRYLVEAFAKVHAQFPETRLLIIGEGPEEQRIRELSAARNLKDFVVMRASIDETATALTMMEMFVLPSLNEGLGLALMEAMAAGVPCVGSAVGGIRSLIHDGKTGLLVPPQDERALAQAMISLLSDRAFAQALSLRAAEYMRAEFPLERMVEETEKVYLSCVHSR
jgi:glycosyltransferase involved in cell wall biosynthesis